MKKRLILCALLCILALAVSASALAAHTGICAVKEEPSVVLAPKGEDDGAGAYAGADQLQLTYSAAQQGKQYVVMVMTSDAVTDEGLLPTKSNIVYMNQTDENGAPDNNVSFQVYPSELTTGTYYVCLSSNADDGNSVRELTQVASFDFYQYGDITGDNTIDISDVQQFLNDFGRNVVMEAGSGRLKTADVTGDSKFDISDVQLLINYVARNGVGVTLGKGN